jgi:2-oxoglutarate dehydrogenase complex, dehydrogenase (E1) component, and related enzymes
MSIYSNQKLEKTSFLSKSNSTFIEQMYLKYLNKDPNLSSDWKKYFDELKEETSIVYKELEGPSWQPQKTKKHQVQEDSTGMIAETKEINSSNNLIYNNGKDFEISSNESIKAIALIRAYRIRGHLIANLDPLGMMDRKYIHELHPEDQRV